MLHGGGACACGGGSHLSVCGVLLLAFARGSLLVVPRGDHKLWWIEPGWTCVVGDHLPLHCLQHSLAVLGSHLAEHAVLGTDPD